ncbi:MAG: hypothetical protein ACE5SW_13100 [Nitrososphaeraceae archaeon]
MIEDISNIKENAEQIMLCDICKEKIFDEKYMSITSSNNKPKLESENEKIESFNEDNKYYNICLECIEKIKDLLTYNYGYDGDLIKYFKMLLEKNKV